MSTSKRSAVDLGAIEAIDKARTPDDWMQGHHVGEPKAICPASAPRTSLLGLDVDGMAIFDREADAAFVVMASKKIGPLCEALREQDDVITKLEAEVARLRSAMGQAEGACTSFFTRDVKMILLDALTVPS